MRVRQQTKENIRQLLYAILIALSLLYLFGETARQSNAGKKSAPPARVTGVAMVDADNFLSLVYAKYGERRILENVTLEDGSLIRIVDILRYDSITSDGAMRRSVARIIEAPRITAKFAAHSYSRLLLPEKLSKNNVDTRKWKIDHDYLLQNSYYHIGTESMFYCDGMKLSRDSDAAVLLLGLGGGVINGFLHHNFPKMRITIAEISTRFANVAMKWFDLKLGLRHSLVIIDGAEFVLKQAKKGVKYDVIILDACYPNRRHKRVCPTGAFLTKNVLRAMSKLVKSQGIIVVNIALPRTRAETDRVLQLFLKHFLYCNLRNTKFRNEILYCMHRSLSEEKHIDLFEFIKNNPLTKN
ncbi:hypothetical protein Y032_0462g1897 [Ancylostoma ceylanicum]|uniref:PABS domain-containing protein n=1 Tax=Ancylostoma ceylanicum TaxID=53326 RepID=A0A016WXM1_9BILA|nr:hypothetical protein Y032_0462g1897 [Ancylostoma ceylanicum]